jgi:hypothetical protein
MGSTGVDSEWTNFKTHVDTYSPNIPVYISAGNHDAGQSGKTYEYPIQYTGNPLYYSFEQGDDVFIMFGMTCWNAPPFSDESLQWLYETLEVNRNKRCFVFQHAMRKGHAGDASGRYSWDALNNTNGKVFLSLMEHYKNVLWFHGHSHCEFEQQDTLSLPNSNYDRAFGCHSIHVPSCCMTRNEDNGYDYEDSEGYVVDVYENGIHLRGRDFIAKKFLPIASYWIDTKLTEISENSYVDTRGVIVTPSYEPILPEGATYEIDKRYSAILTSPSERGGFIAVRIPISTDGTSIYNINISNLPYPTIEFDKNAIHSDGQSTGIDYVNPEAKTSFIALNSATNCSFTSADDKKSCTISCVPSASCEYILLSFLVAESEGQYISSIGKSILEGISVTLTGYSGNYTNVLSSAVDENGDDFVGTNGEDGYTTGYRVKSDGTIIEEVGACATGFIPVEEYDIVRVANVSYGSTTNRRIAFYNSSKEPIAVVGHINDAILEKGNVYVYKAPTQSCYVRVSASTISENTVITINEVITEEKLATNLLHLAIDGNGNDFVGTNGEDGYMTDHRINSSGEMVEETGACATGFIPVKSSSKIRIHRIKIWDLAGTNTKVDRIAFYDDSKTYLGATSLLPATMEDDGTTYIYTVQSYVAGAAFMRFSTGVIDENTIVTVNEPIIIEPDGITLPEGATYTLNARDSYSGQTTKNENGMVKFNIPCEADTTYKLSVENLPISIYRETIAGNTASLFCWDTNKTNVSTIQESNSSSVRDHINLDLVTLTNNDKSFSHHLTTSVNAGYIALSLVISTTEDITEDDIKDIVITLEKVSIDISEINLNKRYSSSGGGLVDAAGSFCFYAPVESNSKYIFTCKNNPFTFNADAHAIYSLDSNKRNPTNMNGSQHISLMTSGVTISNEGCDVEVELTPTKTGYVAISIKLSNSSITTEDMKNIIFTFSRANSQ